MIVIVAEITVWLIRTIDLLYVLLLAVCSGCLSAVVLSVCRDCRSTAAPAAPGDYVGSTTGRHFPGS